MSSRNYSVLPLDFFHRELCLNYSPGFNSISGVTWKGTKLRVGEAKPDFRERYATVVPENLVPCLTGNEE